MIGHGLITVVAGALLVATSCGGRVEEPREESPEVQLESKAEDPFALSPQEIEEAVRYGSTADYTIVGLGSYDLGLNRFELGGGSFVFMTTPYVRVATRARKEASSGGLPIEEATELASRPTELRLRLNITREHLDSPITCHVRLADETLDLTGEEWEMSMCDDESGECMRSASYIFPSQRVGRGAFSLVLEVEPFGERVIVIKAGELL